MKKSSFIFGFILFTILVGYIYAQEKSIPTINWRDADNYVGEEVYVEGVIVATYNSGRACFLNFDYNWKKYFTAVIFPSDYAKFSYKPEEELKGKKVKVRGTIKMYRGKPEIIVKSENQIEIIE